MSIKNYISKNKEIKDMMTNNEININRIDFNPERKMKEELRDTDIERIVHQFMIGTLYHLSQFFDDNTFTYPNKIRCYHKTVELSKKLFEIINLPKNKVLPRNVQLLYKQNEFYEKEYKWYDEFFFRKNVPDMCFFNKLVIHYFHFYINENFNEYFYNAKVQYDNKKLLVRQELSKVFFKDVIGNIENYLYGNNPWIIKN